MSYTVGLARDERRSARFVGRLTRLLHGSPLQGEKRLMGGLVLIIEDEPLLGRNVRTFLQHKGLSVDLATSLSSGIQRYEELQPDLVLIDHNLPDGLGLRLIEHVRRQDRWTKLVMITAHGGVDLAVSAMKAGADDYLTKPVSLDEIGLVATRLLDQARLEGALRYQRDREKDGSTLDRIVGESPAIVEVKRRIRFLTAAERSASPDGSLAGPPVLILGETGTGKELVARALHYEGPRAAQPFIAVNCSTLPEQLIESELFGHERGAFTGAGEKKIGLFQAADGGTLFLDEVGELPLYQQAKFLKALEDRMIRPVGSTRDRPVNVKVVAATNASIEERAARGEFRSDLLYRLNTVVIDLPALRHRGNDVVAVAERLMEDLRRQYGRARLHLTEEARAALLRHPWPGNIRELRNVMEQACLMCARDAIDVEDLNLRPVPSLATQMQPGAAASPTDSASLADVERTLIVDALRQSAGNVTAAAQILGVSRDTLRYRMEKHALRRDYYT